MTRTRPRKRRATLPTLALCLATFAGASGVWSVLAADLPSPSFRPSQLRGLTRWVDPGVIPLTEEGDVDGARTLAIGDSRTWSAVDPHVLNDSEFAPAAVLWGSGGDLRVMLKEAIELGPEVLIVGLTPHSMGPAPNRLFKEVARESAPVFFGSESRPAEVRAWRRAEAAHLEAQGFPEALASVLLRRLEEQFMREHDLHHRWTKRLERRLNAGFARVRFDHVYTVEASRWRRSWFPVHNPIKDARRYRLNLATDHFQEGMESFKAEVTELVRRAAQVSHTVVVRFPLSEEVRAAEEASVTSEWLAEIAENAGVPYVDFGEAVGRARETTDGSHLTTDAARATTRDLVARMLALGLHELPPPSQKSTMATPTEARGSIPGYSFTEPDLRMDLPDELIEISGLVALDSGTLVCLQDETGSLFMLRPESTEPLREIRFAKDGDYEGLTSVKAGFIALRSDGALFELDQGGKLRRSSDAAAAELPHADYEGLAALPDSDAVLLVPKDGSTAKKASKHERPVYSVSLETLVAAPEPYLTLRTDELRRSAEEGGHPLPVRLTKKGKEKVKLDLRVSDLAVHPLTGALFFLSARDGALIAVTETGELVGTAVFPLDELPQLEGLAFNGTGDLFLTSEGVDGPAQLRVFRHSP